MMQYHKSIIEKLTKYQPIIMSETAQSSAVMVILLFDENDQLEIVLTKRAPTLLTYAGDYSFPGGMKEYDDSDLYATAVREVEEELSLPPPSYQLIGQLDDFKDRDGLLVRPFITLMQKNDFERLHKHADAEISEVYRFPLAKLDEIRDNPKLHHITKRKPSYSFTDNGVFIWGLTASILVHLLNVITGANHPLGKSIPTSNRD